MSKIQLNPDQVVSVYSGINGRCCCGCSGKYSYAKAYQEQGSKKRGYPVQDDEVSDRSVRLIVGKMNAAGIESEGYDTFSAVVGNRLYLAVVNSAAVGAG